MAPRLSKLSSGVALPEREFQPSEVELFLYNAATMDDRMPREVMPVKPTTVADHDSALKARKARRDREREARRSLDMPRSED